MIMAGVLANHILPLLGVVYIVKVTIRITLVLKSDGKGKMRGVLRAFT